MEVKHLKLRCAGCERTDVKMNKEHVFPKWLIERTGTHRTGIRWGSEKKVPGLSATLPLCVECNTVFGKALEGPVARIFEDLEQQRGISDNEAELLIRWLWKMEGIFWAVFNPNGKYSPSRTLRGTISRPLDDIRGRLVLAISLIEKIDQSHGDKPLGLDSEVSVIDGIFVSGVFSETALMVLLSDFAHMVPRNFSMYSMAVKIDAVRDGKLFHPKIGFADDNKAVLVTMTASRKLKAAHEAFARKLQREHAAQEDMTS